MAAVSEKELNYINLVKKISQCTCCEDIKVPSFNVDGECLLNDSHGILFDQSGSCSFSNIYVNRWNCWQGSLNAKIMLIGQDYGNVDNIQQPQQSGRWRMVVTSREDAQRKWNSPTDSNLFYLFQTVFNINLGEENENLFFTNLACCYRKNKTSGRANDAWFYLCAHKFMGDLISIIQPEIIIALGERVFNSLGYCSNASLRLIETSSTKKLEKMTFADYVSECRFELQFIDDALLKIPVYPVFHPGSYSNLNRPLEKQVQDWNRIKELEPSLGY